MKQLSIKLLVNAESFGFGPTAAIASFFPELRKRFVHIAYAGAGHSLDLQRKLPYDAMYDISGQRADKTFQEVLGEYDMLFTALDFQTAHIAVASDKPTVIYDPLTWYWPDIPSVVAGQNTLYLAQDFFGVKERLSQDREKFANPKIVSPIVADESQSRSPERALINLGGLQNPFWSLEVTAAYAKTVLRALKEVVPATDNALIVSSMKIADKLKGFGVVTLSREEILSLFPTVKYAIMTPGLGNIYDAASYGIPTLFLPPANDSQALQLHALRREDAVDAALDWPEIDPNACVNYANPQSVILEAIASAVQSLSRDSLKTERFKTLCKREMEKISQRRQGQTGELLRRFGHGGVTQVVDAVYAFAAKFEPT